MPRITSPRKTYCFYRNQLTPERREIYDTLAEGVATWQTQIPLKKKYSLKLVCRI